MDDKKPRFGGSKVSEIANRFQNRMPAQKEEIIVPIKAKQKQVHSQSLDNESPSVTVVRTESHVTRFNNARALFEKLGEENRNSRERIIPLQSTKSASSILDSRSRSSSANSETRETKSHTSRSPSPPAKKSLDSVISNSVPVLNDNEKTKKTNGFNANNGADECKSAKTNGNSERTNANVVKKPEKPEKPERKFNSKELIEKQRNWTSHFSKTRTNRYNSDPNNSEVKLAVNNGNRDCDNKAISAATRSASFNNRIRSPPTSPTSPTGRSEATRRTNVVRKERPASVIPTTYVSPTKKDRSPVTSPTISPAKEAPPKQPRTTSLNLSNDAGRYRYEDSIDKEDGSPPPPIVPKCLFKDSPADRSNDELLAPQSFIISKSPLEDHDTSRENLSATSGSLSSLSPPSSPSKLKSEQEKQEQECNEKSFNNREYFEHIYIMIFKSCDCSYLCFISRFPMNHLNGFVSQPLHGCYPIKKFSMSNIDFLLRIHFLNYENKTSYLAIMVNLYNVTVFHNKSINLVVTKKKSKFTQRCVQTKDSFH